MNDLRRTYKVQTEKKPPRFSFFDIILDLKNQLHRSLNYFSSVFFKRKETQGFLYKTFSANCYI